MPVIIGIIIVIITIMNAWHIINQAFSNPPHYVFTGIAHYSADYFLYISHITQGQQTISAFTQHQFTNESLSPTWIYWFNASLGVFHANPFLTYNVALVFLVVLLLMFLWWIVKQVIADRFTQVFAFLFIVTASSFPAFLGLKNDFWFSPTPALNRLGGVPHQVLQTILILSVLTLGTHLFTQKKGSILFYGTLIIISVLATTANPIQMILVAITFVILFIWRTYNKQLTLHDVLLALSIFIPSFLAAYLTNLEFSHQPILMAAKTWENNQHVRVSIPQFLSALGPILVFLPFGIFTYNKKKHPLATSLILYTCTSLGIFFSPIPNLLGTASVRWLSPAAYIGIPLLSSYGYVWCIRIFGQQIKNQTIALFLFVMLYILFTAPSLLAQIQARTSPLKTDKTLIALNHISPEVMDGLTSITQTPKNGVVLTDPTLPYDVVVPVITGHKSFTGHPIHTLYPDVKNTLRRQFFSETMTEKEALQFLTNHSIGVIITVPNSPLSKLYPFLAKTFSNSALTMYTVSNQ